jgi:hypothetical protein
MSLIHKISSLRPTTLLIAFFLSVVISACDHSPAEPPSSPRGDDSSLTIPEPGNSKLASLIQQCGEVHGTWKEHIKAVSQSLEQYGVVREINILDGAVRQLSDLEIEMNHRGPGSDLDSQKIAISVCYRTLTNVCAELDLVDDWVLKNIGDSYQSRKLEQVSSRIAEVRERLSSDE